MITKIAERLGFEQKDIAYIDQCYKAVLADPESLKKMYEAMDRLFGIQGDEDYMPLVTEIAQKVGYHKFTVTMVLLLMSAVPLRYIYFQKGYPEEIYWQTLSDMLYKLNECKQVDGICGTWSGPWFKLHYRCKLFMIGRLQYEPIAFPYDSYADCVKKGDTVYNCHIPSSGPIKEELVMQSLKGAYAFFSKDLKNGLMPVYCSSWLLYPGHDEIYAEGSNLQRFSHMFDILAQSENTSNSNAWRVFGYHHDPEKLHELPEKTSLQRNLKKYLMEGKNMGSARGIFLFDGERVINSGTR